MYHQRMSQRRRLLQKQQNRNVRDQFRLWTKISGIFWNILSFLLSTVTSLGSQNSRIPPPIFQIALNVFSCFSTSLKQHQDLPFDIIIECVRDPRLLQESLILLCRNVTTHVI